MVAALLSASIPAMLAIQAATAMSAPSLRSPFRLAG